MIRGIRATPARGDSEKLRNGSRRRTPLNKANPIFFIVLFVILRIIESG